MVKNIKKYLLFIIIIGLTPNLYSRQITYFEHDHLTSDWFGLRDILSEAGIDFEIAYRNDLLRIFKQDTNNKPLFIIQNLDADIFFNLEKLAGIKGANFLVDMQLISSHLPNKDVLHSVQGLSNNDANNNLIMFECFYNQMLLDNGLRFKFGLIDFNTEFDVKNTGSNFITPSHGTGTDVAASGRNGPSIYPVTSMSLFLEYKPDVNTSIKLGIFDGIPGDTLHPKGTRILLDNTDGLFVCSEANYVVSRGSSQKMDFYFSLGAWYMTDYMNQPFSHVNSHGIYALAQIPLTKEELDATQGLSSYFRVGYVKSPVNPTKFFTAGALEYKGLISSREDDFLGIGFTFSSISDSYLKKMKTIYKQPDKTDSNIELYYKMQIFPFFFVQPDIQYFPSPMIEKPSKGIFAGGIRTIVMI